MSTIKQRIIELKLAKVCSTDIREQLGCGSGLIEQTWAAYRRANPTTSAVGVGTHSGKRTNK